MRCREGRLSPCHCVPLPVCDAPSRGSHAGLVGSQLPRASVSLHHRPFLLHGACPRRPWHSQAPGQVCAGAECQGSRCPRGVAISPGVPRETPLVLTAVPRYSGEALPGESLSHRRPHLPSPWRDPPTPRHGLYKYGHRTPRREGRSRGQGAAGSGGERLWGRGGAGAVPSPAEGAASRGSARPRRGCA